MGKRVSMALVLILSGQVSAQERGFDPRLAVTLTTMSGKVVEIRGPEIITGADADLDYRWGPPTVQANRTGKFVAVHYSGNKAPWWASEVYLVRPDGRVDRLRNDAVFKVTWTVDGSYLIGFGDNTLTIWNVSGGLRQVAFQDIRAFNYSSKNEICLNLAWYSPTTGQPSRTTEVHLAVPSLTRIFEKDTDGQQTCEAP
ncbi:hypothetical protein [Deinococcus koreensis]|uniref:WD40 repeat domain-containing protein n=1 Tax=Deinococcus koreensis TaxID=2054903 RepID=A0A2K3V107_9DEIO|nr:hypothetical protein [Deinococcus koreensis]PNY82463.1 hypothetical protein CVO96_14895 [Deinococcus koreensis]